MHKYSLGAQSLAVVAGILGQSLICSANITALDVGTFTNGETIIADGSGSLGISETLDITQTAASSGKLFFLGYTGGATGAVVRMDVQNNTFFHYSAFQSGFRTLKYFAPGDSVDITNLHPLTNTAVYISKGNLGGNLGEWTVDRPSGAIGFRNGDGEFGYMHVSWVASTKTLTFLGNGFFDDTPGTSITVVPEPSEYAAALGLGALSASLTIAAVPEIKPGQRIIESDLQFHN